MVVRVLKHTSYNPSYILSQPDNREEYDFLFSIKGASSQPTFVENTLEQIKEIGWLVIETFTGNSQVDPSKLGELQRLGTIYAAGFQCALGLSKALTGDVYSGLYNSLLGVLGVSCSREGKSKDMLKTYVVISFINGCVQGMELFQLSLVGIPLFGHGMPTMMAVGHTITLLNPCTSFIGAYLGWQFIKAAKQQYMIALAQYHIQMLMMQQHQQMVQQTLQNDVNQIKHLPPICEEDDEEEGKELVECTGGTESCCH